MRNLATRHNSRFRSGCTTPGTAHRKAANLSAKLFDIAIIGAGAAGMFCAALAGRRGASVVLIDHSERLAEKIRISGGGRCNFTNLQAGRIDRYVGADPAFAEHALASYRPAEFLRLIRSHGIDYHEKHRGQLFCDDSSERIIAMLRAECERGRVNWLRPVQVRAIQRRDDRFIVDTSGASVGAAKLVIATGGLSIPKIGASDLGYRTARQFGIDVIEPYPALVPLRFDAQQWSVFAELAGVSVPVGIGIDGTASVPRFDEDLLFTHRGLSGPAALQISSYWSPGTRLSVDLMPGRDAPALLRAAKSGSRKSLANALGELLPKRLALGWLQGNAIAEAPRKLAEIGDRRLAEIGAALARWPLSPIGTEGFQKAEATRGGIATAALEPRSMQTRAVPGLYFIGEVVDITGWLGGYNFQWAWSSAWVCAHAMTA